MTEEIKHIGTEESGRYPRGSGKDPLQSGHDFTMTVADLRKKGLTEKQIAEGKGISIASLRARVTLDKAEKNKLNTAEAVKLKNKGYSYAAIAKKMEISDHTVAALLDPVIQKRASSTETIANVLKEHIASGKYVDVGAGVEVNLGVSRTKLNASIESLVKNDDFKLHEIYELQQGTGKYTTMKVLTGPEVTTKEVNKNRTNIKPPFKYSEDGGETFEEPSPPKMISSKRIIIRGKEEGGEEYDGLIELRRGVDDISLGNARYAQVRIGVDGTHYMKGMAVYTDDLPSGVDIRYNSNKLKNDPKVFKKFESIGTAENELKLDPDLPFGSRTRPKHYIDSKGQKQTGVLNIVNEEGDWTKWSNKLSSQFLSKQSPSLVKQQLELTLAIKKSEFEDLMSLTNPAIKQRLLSSDGGFADDCDAAAVHLKAAGLPRTANHVILPFPGMKETEIYAPGYNQGEKVVLIRHPHGGRFEIPELTVNNKYGPAKAIIDRAKDAVGIHPKVASKLSGADFDGDTVLVIPNKDGLVSSKPSIKSLIGFNTREAYTNEKLPPMSDQVKQREMGKASNLITDMTIKGARPDGDEIARAVKYSMVVIDAQKHSLDYKQAAKDFNIPDLKVKYQGRKNGGASTLISLAGSDKYINERKLGVFDPATKTKKYVDPKTGKLLYRDTGRTYEKPVVKIRSIDGKKIKVTEMIDGTFKPTSEITKNDYANVKTVTIKREMKTTKMAFETNAFKLSSGMPVENIYAAYANELKSLANLARKKGSEIEFKLQSPSAKKVYASEVETLQKKLNAALMNKPLERRAHLLAANTIYLKKVKNPHMSAEELKSQRGKQLVIARDRVGAKKEKIIITDKEWEAIQSGAISKNILSQILSNTDLDSLKQRAMPRESKSLAGAKLSRAQSMYANGYTQAEIASSLGVSVNSIASILN